MRWLRCAAPLRRWSSQSSFIVGGGDQDVGEGDAHVSKQPITGVKNTVVLKKLTLLDQLRRKDVDPFASNVPSHQFSRMRSSHKATHAAMRHIERYMKASGVNYRMVEELSHDDVEWADLLLSIGGDGTFLRASHSLTEKNNIPIMGINSSPATSYGFFCSCDKNTFPDLFERILRGEVGWYPLYRMKIFINGEPLPIMALNDALITSSTAATTVRYGITHKGRHQIQKSSGIWLATSAGSTGAILSAGGSARPLSERKLQFRVRELFAGAIEEPPVLGGFVDETFEIISRMHEGKIFFDGHKDSIELSFGDRITVRCSDTPLKWVRPANFSRFRDKNAHNMQEDTETDPDDEEDDDHVSSTDEDD